MKPEDKPRLDKFRDLARELETDEDSAHFEETLKKIATKTPAETRKDAE